MFLALFLLKNAISIINLTEYLPEESPKTIHLVRGQILAMKDFYESTFEILIPDDFASPRYIINSYLFSRYYSFANNATITMHFSSNISFYILNVTQYNYKDDEDYKFLIDYFGLSAYEYRMKEEMRKEKNVVRGGTMIVYGFTKISDFTSQPPFSLKILSTTSLHSNAQIEIDHGSGKHPISTYFFYEKCLPFNSKLYITYKKCDSFYFKNISLTFAQNLTVQLTMSDIPQKCHSYSSSVLVKRDFPLMAKLFYRLNDEQMTQISFSRGNNVYLSRNFPYSLSFYIQYSRCIDFFDIKTVSVDDPFTLRKINISASDVPDECLPAYRETPAPQPSVSHRIYHGESAHLHAPSFIE